MASFLGEREIDPPAPIHRNKVFFRSEKGGAGLFILARELVRLQILFGSLNTLAHLVKEPLGLDALFVKPFAEVVVVLGCHFAIKGVHHGNNITQKKVTVKR